MATPNYSYEKRQRELAKKRKLEEKKQRKTQPRPDGPVDETAPDASSADGPAAPPPSGA